MTLQTELPAAKSLQSCPTLCDPINGSPPGSPVPGILQAGTLEWVAISFCMKMKSEREVARFVPNSSDPMDCGLPGSPSMGFSRQEYWSGVPLPSPSESIVYLKIYSWCGTCSGFAQMCHGSTSIESHMVFTALNILCAPPVHPSPSYSLSTTDLLTVFLVLPFPE